MSDRTVKTPAEPATWKRAGILGTAAVLLAGAGLWLTIRPHPRAVAPRLIYTPEGYGGFVPAPVPAKSGRHSQAIAIPSALRDPVRSSQDAYAAGHYAEAESQARRVIVQAALSPTPVHRRQAAFARQVLAYSAARQAVGTQRAAGLQEARIQFTALKVAAEAIPDRGLEPALPGQVAPTLEAEAVFQHAVCTGALGDKAGAEAEYVAFMKRYPDSPLLHAAVLRLQRMHGGDLTAAEETIRQGAVRIAQERQEAQAREASLCGPECLAELLRRRSDKADVHALADEMGTSGRGTSLASLAAAAQRHGFSPQGLALTQTGLTEQRMPVVALVAPGHYVVVEAATAQTVTVWDPDAHGVGRGDRRVVAATDWRRRWQGATLALAPAAARTGQR